MNPDARCQRCNKPLYPRGAFACRGGYPDHLYQASTPPGPPSAGPGKVALLGLWMKWRRAKGAVDKEERMGFDVKIMVQKGLIEFVKVFGAIAFAAILAAGQDPAIVGAVVLHSGASAATCAAITALAVALFRMGANAWKNAPGGKVPPPYTFLLPLLLVASLSSAQEPGAQPLTVHADAFTWKSLLRQAGATDDAWGGRITLGVQGLPGGLEVGCRVDISALRPVDLGNPDITALKTLEGYVSLHRRVLEGHGLVVSPAFVVGTIRSFDSPGHLRAEHPAILGAGIRLSRRGAWMYALAGIHEAAGPGTRVLVAGHLPLWGAFGLAGDVVTGTGGFTRLGATVRLPAPW